MISGPSVILRGCFSVLTGGDDDAGDDGPGELVQSFDEGTSWNVR
jgi:hypothetical protein